MSENENESEDKSEGEETPYRGITEWSPEARQCEHCGERVNRRWRMSTKLVCVACVPWGSERSM